MCGVRYAIYFAPDPNSALARFGNGWLGFEPGSGEHLAPPEVKGVAADEIAELTESPSRYGFHGTLKAPFPLAQGHRVEELDRAAGELAAGFRSFEIAPMRVDRIGSFIALTPGEPSPSLARLAAACVRELDRFRARRDGGPVNQRRDAGLSGRQKQLQQRWGYPYVLDEFRFHLTLSGKLDKDRGLRLWESLRDAMSPLLAEPLPVRDIALYRDPGDGGRFRLLKRYPLDRAGGH